MNDPQNLEETLFEAVLHLPPEQRAAHLQKVCGEDASLRQRVELLLKSFEQAASGFLERPHALGPNKTSAAPAPLPIKALPSQMIGRYKLLEKIGEGGFGEVYAAEQREPVKRRVALKIIKPGMDTRQVIARFEAERQALALMDHPNIARVFDAGATESGRPYFVMELVRGIRITDFCDEASLPMEKRLALFVQVCQAIQHAHQKGVIHRDIKPSNILVTRHDGLPVPKVIDFGIAKATTDQRLTDKTVFTAFGQFIGTPAYMSPEQAEMSGLDVDTRSDIYSLGVLLYELLTGKTPFDAGELSRAGVDAMRRVIREQEPARPSTRLSTMLAGELVAIAGHRQVEPARLATLICGDLDWIVMKALEKDRTRRYETANGLAMDVQRVLNNEPIVARPPSRLYRFQKLVRRNQLAFAAAGAVAVALVAGLGISTWMFFNEKRARQRAVAAEQRAVTEAAKSQQVATFLKDMLNGVGPSAALGRDRTMLREILDKTAERIGRDLTNQPAVQIELRLTLADIYHALTLYQNMEDMARENLRLARATFGEDSTAVADALCQVGDALMHRRVLDEAETLTRQSLALQTKLRGRKTAEAAAALYTLSAVLRFQWSAGVPDAAARLAEAEAVTREALATRRKLFGNEHPDVAKSLDSLSAVLRNEDKPVEAEAVARESLALRNKMFPGDHPDLTRSLQFLGEILADQGKLDEAEKLLREGLEMGRRMQGEGGLALAHAGLARVLERQGKLPEAEILFRKAVELGKKHMGDDHPDVVTYLSRLAEILHREGKLDEAAAAEREALAILRKRSGDADPNSANLLATLASTLLANTKFAEAEPLARECLAIREKKIPDDWQTFNARSLLGGSLCGQGKFAEAESLLRTAYEGLKQREARIPASGKPALQETQQRLVQLYEATSRPAPAAGENSPPKK